jgi:geranylgeranyl diphosphate synthase, type I
MLEKHRALPPARIAPAPPPGEPPQPIAQDLGAVEDVLARFLLAREASCPVAESVELVRWVRDALAGGKRLRPLLCCVGWRAGGGQGGLPVGVARVAASLELFHTFAVLHDDVMDGSATRRGLPTAQRLVAARHAGHPGAEKVGLDTAILLGDIALGWSYELVQEAQIDPPAAERVWQALAAMRTETVVGQYLDLTGSDVFRGHGAGDVEEALRTARGKTAGYTFAWPLRVGAVLAGADDQVLSTCTDFGVAVGEAFQLRDDLLDAFGDPDTTGKQAGGDLRNGKNTVLLAVAWRDATEEQRGRLTRLVGDPALDEAGVDEVRRILTETGARTSVEAMITARFERAVAALDAIGIPPAAVAALTDLALAATVRDR